MTEPTATKSPLAGRILRYRRTGMRAVIGDDGHAYWLESGGRIWSKITAEDWEEEVHMTDHTHTLTEAEREALTNWLRHHRAAVAADDVFAAVERILAARAAATLTDGLRVTQWDHARWHNSHEPAPTDVRLRPEGGNGAHPLMARCAICNEVLLPAAFAALSLDPTPTEGADQ